MPAVRHRCWPALLLLAWLAFGCSPTVSPRPAAASSSATTELAAGRTPCVGRCHALNQHRLLLERMLADAERRLVELTAPTQALSGEVLEEVERVAQRRLVVTIALSEVELALRLERSRPPTIEETAGGDEDRLETEEAKKKKPRPKVPSVAALLEGASDRLRRAEQDRSTMLGIAGGGGWGWGSGGKSTGESDGGEAGDEDKHATAPLWQGGDAPVTIAAASTRGGAPPPGVGIAINHSVQGIAECVRPYIRDEPIQLNIMVRLAADGRLRDARVVEPADLPAEAEACVTGQVDGIRIPDAAPGATSVFSFRVPVSP